MATTIKGMDVGRQGRTIRRPVHTWQLRHKPWQLQPCLLAPVLPGETLRNMLFQARAVTDPIKNPLIGWHLEYYFFYVKHRDLDDRDTLTNMVLEFSTDVSSLRSAASAQYYHFDNGINWAQKCLKRVVEEYFRNEGEAWDVVLLPASTGLPVAAIGTESWLHSAQLSSAISALDISLTDVGSPGGAGVTTSEIDTAMRQWEFLRTNQLTTMDYEQFLATYGVRPRREELHIPELIRYVKQWQYPSNTIDPADGSPSSAVSWAIAERADKDRFFREPGFIFGLSCVRPKVYRQNQDGSAAGLLDNAFAWLPAIMSNDPATSLKEVAGSEGPLDTLLAANYVVDIRDLFIHGDQFANFALSATDANAIAIPRAALDDPAKRYPVEADADELFAVDTAEMIRQDGVCTLTIATVQEDTTPSSGFRML